MAFVNLFDRFEFSSTPHHTGLGFANLPDKLFRCWVTFIQLNQWSKYQTAAKNLGLSDFPSLLWISGRLLLFMSWRCNVLCQTLSRKQLFQFQSLQELTDGCGNSPVWCSSSRSPQDKQVRLKTNNKRRKENALFAKKYFSQSLVLRLTWVAVTWQPQNVWQK